MLKTELATKVIVKVTYQVVNQVIVHRMKANSKYYE